MKRLLSLSKQFIWGCAGPALLFSFVLVAGVASTLAQDVDCVFVSPSMPLIAGNRDSIWLACMNSSPHEITRTFESIIPCTLVSDSGFSETALLLNTNSTPVQATIEPGSFVKAEYLLDVPLASSGQVTLTVTNYNQLVVLVQQATTVLTLEPKLLSPSIVTNAPTNVEMWDFLRSHLYFYEPIYFVLGTAPASEFQLSLKYKLFNSKAGWNPFTHLYFGYTQTSFWSVFSKNPAFFDTSYKPSTFFYYPDVVHNRYFQFDLQLGGEHESNGRGGTLERSFDTAYLQPTATFGLPYRWQLTLQPRAWFYFLVGENNPDIASYRGYADLRAALTWTSATSGEKIQFATRFRTGDDGSHVGVLYTVRFNLARLPLLRNFNPAIQAQYFGGYGQNLLQYNESAHAFRAGICLWY